MIQPRLVYEHRTILSFIEVSQVCWSKLKVYWKTDVKLIKYFNCYFLRPPKWLL
jgi:hypothetical protein